MLSQTIAQFRIIYRLFKIIIVVQFKKISMRCAFYNVSQTIEIFILHIYTKHNPSNLLHTSLFLRGKVCYSTAICFNHI